MGKKKNQHNACSLETLLDKGIGLLKTCHTPFPTCKVVFSLHRLVLMEYKCADAKAFFFLGGQKSYAN